jgi:hypothetical protein
MQGSLLRLSTMLNNAIDSCLCRTIGIDKWLYITGLFLLRDVSAVFGDCQRAVRSIKINLQFNAKHTLFHLHTQRQLHNDGQIRWKYVAVGINCGF